MRSNTLWLAGLALAVGACTSEENPSGPSTPTNFARTRAYTVVDLGPFDAADINSRGQVAGAISVQVGEPDDPETEDRAIIWDKGVITDLTSKPSSARAINASGQVAGFLGNVDGGHAFLWDKGVTTDLGTLGGSISDAIDINAGGQVAGWSFTTGDQRIHAVLWSKGVMTDLGTLGTGLFSEAFGINAAGQVVGQSTTDASNVTHHAFLWSNGVMTDLGTLGGDYSVGRAINSHGDVVGISTINPGEFQFHAFLWKDGVMTDLGTLGGNQSDASDINAAGQVVGTSETAGLGGGAFIWENGVMSDLGGADANTGSRAIRITASGDVLGMIFGRAVLWTRHPH